jgi:hypothetical protein
MITHVVSRIGTWSTQKSYLKAPIYTCKACDWTGTIIESCVHIAANQIEVIAPPKINRSTIS